MLLEEKAEDEDSSLLAGMSVLLYFVEEMELLSHSGLCQQRVENMKQKEA